MRLIDADALKEKIDNMWNGRPLSSLGARILVTIDDAPSIDIEPKRGEWIDKGWKGYWQFETDGRGNCWHEYECSECGFHNKGGKPNFCPNCGARMKGADDE